MHGGEVNVVGEDCGFRWRLDGNRWIRNTSCARIFQPCDTMTDSVCRRIRF